MSRSARGPEPMIIKDGDRVLIDRQTLARLTHRSVHTIRARCDVVEHRGGRALYDMDQAERILDAIPTRRRREVDQATTRRYIIPTSAELCPPSGRALISLVAGKHTGYAVRQLLPLRSRPRRKPLALVSPG